MPALDTYARVTPFASAVLIGVNPYTRATENYFISRITPFVDMVHQGADPTGASDSSPALLAAAGSYPNAILFFRNGTYIFNSGLVRAVPNLCLVGETRDGTTLHFTGTGDFLTLGSDNGSYQTYDGIAQSWRLENLTLQGSGTNAGAPGTARGIVDWRGGAGICKNVRFKQWQTGFWGLNSDLNSWEDCIFHDSGVGVNLINRSDQNSFERCYWYYNTMAVRGEYASHATFKSCTFNTNWQGDFYLAAPPTTSSSFGIPARTEMNWEASDCWFEAEAAQALVPAHVVIAPDGDSTRILRGFKFDGGHVVTVNTAERFMEAYAATKIIITAPHMRGTSSRFVNTNAVSGVTIGLIVRDPIMPTNTTTIIGGNSTGGSMVEEPLKNAGVAGLNIKTNGPYLRMGGFSGSEFRLNWDLADKVQLQKNTGTESAPTWADIINFSSSLGTGKTRYYSTAAPTSGTFVQGDEVVNVAPGPGTPVLWRCIVAGTPGTWEAVGAPIQINVVSYGADPTGVTDSTAAITNAISLAISRKMPLYFPAGTYKVSSTLQVNSFGVKFIAPESTRPSLGVASAQISYTGTGACIQLGTDNGHAYDAADYDGPGAYAEFHNIAIVYGGTSTTALANGQGTYGTGTYGIRDWRGGELVCDNVWIENFAYGFWGIQSDINDFTNCHINRCHVGMYLGPRSDQNTVSKLYTLYNDTDVQIDRVSVARFRDCQFVGGGSATTYPIVVGSAYSVGSRKIKFDGCWFEHYQGYASGVPAFIAVGVGDTVTSVGVKVVDCGVFTNAQGGGSGPYFQYILRLGNCDRILLEDPEGDTASLAKIIEFVGTSNANVLVKATQSLNSSTLNSGTGTPQVTRWTYGGSFAGTLANLVNTCTTAGRPASVTTGTTVFDTTLNKLITWNGTVWKDGTGATV